MAAATRRIEMCVSDIHSWMAVNMLKLNTDKTELLYFHSRFRPRLQLNPIQLGSDVIFPSSHAKNIGVIFDSSLTMSRHINAIVKSGYCHLRNIAKIRNVLTLDTTKILIHAFVVLKIDSYNSLIFGLPKHLIDKFQHLLNAAARLIMVANKYDSITPILKELHWLPVEQRIIFKINLITFKCLNNLAPSYLKELLTLYRPNKTLRSSSDKLRLVTVPYNLKTYGYRSYSVHAPILWNSLPLHSGISFYYYYYYCLFEILVYCLSHLCHLYLIKLLIVFYLHLRIQSPHFCTVIICCLFSFVFLNFFRHF